MATDFTPHYNLDKYTATDKPNLRDQYNAAMDKIDNALLSANTNATEAKNNTLNFQTQLDAKADSSDVTTEIATAVTTERTARENADTQLSNRIDALDAKSITEGNVIKYGAVEGASDNDWNTIFSNAIANTGCVYFPNGVWIIQGAYSLVNCKALCGSGATILQFTSASSCIDVSFTEVDHRHCMISGIEFDGKSTAETALRISTANSAHISNCKFTNFVSRCIDATMLGLVVTDCEFYGKSDSATYTCGGIFGTTDNLITSCKFFHLRIGISIQGTSNIIGCYMYTSPNNNNHNNLKTFGIGNFEIVSNEVLCNSLIQTNIIGCEFDTITYSIGECVNTKIRNCVFLWDSTTNTSSVITSIFYANKSTSGSRIAQRVEFSENQISIPITNDFTLYTFYSSVEKYVYMYHSEKCSVSGFVPSSCTCCLTIGNVEGQTGFVYPVPHFVKAFNQWKGYTSPNLTRLFMQNDGRGIDWHIDGQHLEGGFVVSKYFDDQSTTRRYTENTGANGSDVYIGVNDWNEINRLTLTGFPYNFIYGKSFQASEIPSTFTAGTARRIQFVS